MAETKLISFTVTVFVLCVFVLLFGCSYSSTLLLLLGSAAFYYYYLFDHGMVSAMEKKAVFITGCDSGFGLALAKQLSDLGVPVFAGCLFPDRTGAKELHSKNGVKVLKLDVTKPEDIDDCLKKVDQELTQRNLQGLWGLVNNAGLGSHGPIELTDMAIYRKLIDVNVVGTTQVTKAFLPLVRQAKGRVVIMGSLGSIISPQFSSVYCMTKHAIRAFTDTLRWEMNRFGVKVSAIEPVYYQTPIMKNFKPKEDTERLLSECSEELKKAYADDVPNMIDDIQAGKDVARPNIQEVIDCMISGLFSQKPHSVYTGHWLSSCKRQLMVHSPEFIMRLAVLSTRKFKLM